MQDNDDLPVKLLLLVSLLQGLALLFLHQAIELKFWPHSSPQWIFSLYSIALAGPVKLLHYFENKRWNKANVHQVGDQENFDKKFVEALKAGQYELSSPKWKDLKMGGQHFEVR